MTIQCAMVGYFIAIGGLVFRCATQRFADAIFLVEPAAQIDHLASFAAERPKSRVVAPGDFDDVLAGGAGVAIHQSMVMTGPVMHEAPSRLRRRRFQSWLLALPDPVVEGDFDDSLLDAVFLPESVLLDGLSPD